MKTGPLAERTGRCVWSGYREAQVEMETGGDRKLEAIESGLGEMSRRRANREEESVDVKRESVEREEKVRTIRREDGWVRLGWLGGEERKKKGGGGGGGTKRVRETGSCEQSRAAVCSERRWRKRSLGLSGSDRPRENEKRENEEKRRGAWQPPGSIPGKDTRYTAIDTRAMEEKVKITALVMGIHRPRCTPLRGPPSGVALSAAALWPCGSVA